MTSCCYWYSVYVYVRFVYDERNKPKIFLRQKKQNRSVMIIIMGVVIVRCWSWWITNFFFKHIFSLVDCKCLSLSLSVCMLLIYDRISSSWTRVRSICLQSEDILVPTKFIEREAILEFLRSNYKQSTNQFNESICPLLNFLYYVQ